MKSKFQPKILLALLLTVPIALLFLVADGFTASTVQADEEAESLEISSPATRVGYGLKAIKVKVGKTKSVKAARRGELATDLTIGDPDIAEVRFETRKKSTKVKITGVTPGTTWVRWVVDETVIERDVIVRSERGRRWWKRFHWRDWRDWRD